MRALTRKENVNQLGITWNHCLGMLVIVLQAQLEEHESLNYMKMRMEDKTEHRNDIRGNWNS